MKLKLNIIALLISTILLAFSCSSDSNDNPSNNSGEVNDIVNTVETGNWIVTYFYDTDSDETNNFAGYVFTFENSDTLMATNGTNTYSGTWSVTDSNSNEDSSNDIDFNISFSTPPDFEELSDDWDIVSHSSTKIELTDVSGGNGGMDFLTFERN